MILLGQQVTIYKIPLCNLWHFFATAYIFQGSVFAILFKGQLISNGLFGVIARISALKSNPYYNHVWRR